MSLGQGTQQAVNMCWLFQRKVKSCSLLRMSRVQLSLHIPFGGLGHGALQDTADAPRVPSPGGPRGPAPWE